MLALLLGATLALASDPYGPPPAPGTSEALVHDAMFGKPGAEAAIEKWLAANPDAPVEQRLALLHRLCLNYGVRGSGKARAEACEAKVRLDPKGDGNDAQLATILRDVPAIRATGTAELTLASNPLGSKSIDVTANGTTASWIFDTGAEISVATQTTAEAMGARFLPGTVEVGTATTPVHGRVAVIDRVQIGASTLENLPVLVLPDAQLRIIGYTIPGILGLPAMAAYGRVAWSDRGKRLALGDVPLPWTHHAPVYWHEEGLGIPIATQLGMRGAHLDTGANASYLRAPGRALLSAEEQAAVIDKTVHVGGAGGIVKREQKQLPRFAFTIAGAPIAIEKVRIEDDNQEGAGRIGSDILRQLSLFAIDFERMELEAEPVAGD